MKDFMRLVLTVALIVGGMAAIKSYEENPEAFEANIKQFVDGLEQEHREQTFIDIECEAASRPGDHY